jgi:outer membrane protein W
VTAIVGNSAARGVMRFSQRVDDDALLVPEAEKFAAQAATALGLELAPAAAAESAPLVADASVNVKLGNTIPSLHGATLNDFNVKFDLEGDYYLNPRWQLFLQAGVIFGSATDTSGTQPATTKSFQLFPAYAGVKYTFRALQAIRPYASVGLGLSLLNKIFQRTSTAGFTTQGVLGIEWVPTRHFGLNLEASGNLAGVSSDGSGVYLAFNTNFGVLALF